MENYVLDGLRHIQADIMGDGVLVHITGNGGKDMNSCVSSARGHE